MKVVKRKSNLIPYRLRDNRLEFFLSLRSKTATQYPNHWSFWGGSIEQSETPDQALRRELQEELEWMPQTCEFLGTYYDSTPNEKFIYFTKVGNSFAREIRINESQGGKFFTIEEIEQEKAVIPEDKGVLVDLHGKLRS